MATRGAEPGDSYLYPSFNYPFVGRLPRGKTRGWKKHGFLPPFVHHHPVAVFTDQQRASLKSLLAQINPKLTPRIRRANTKDAAVQVGNDSLMSDPKKVVSKESEDITTWKCLGGIGGQLTHAVGGTWI